MLSLDPTDRPFLNREACERGAVLIDAGFRGIDEVEESLRLAGCKNVI